MAGSKYYEFYSRINFQVDLTIIQFNRIELKCICKMKWKENHNKNSPIKNPHLFEFIVETSMCKHMAFDRYLSWKKCLIVWQAVDLQTFQALKGCNSFNHL